MKLPFNIHFGNGRQWHPLYLLNRNIFDALVSIWIIWCT